MQMHQAKMHIRIQQTESKTTVRMQTNYACWLHLQAVHALIGAAKVTAHMEEGLQQVTHQHLY